MNEALEGIVTLVRDKAGVDLTSHKPTLLLYRLQRRMEYRRVPLFRDYFALLNDDPVELETMVRGIPIHVTEFFRDPDAWDVLARDVIPKLFEEAGDGSLRVWTPACSTGEEAYSLAMLLAEHASGCSRPVDFKLFASDASADIVARASRGTFKAAAMNGLTPQRRQRFFYAVDGAFRVKRELREKMVFAQQDVLTDPPFPALDLVTCRNLLIYLEQDASRRVVSLLHSALRVGGHLFLGKAESLPTRPALGFEELVPGLHVYRKVTAASPVDFEFPKRPARLRAARSSRSAVDAHSHVAALLERDLPAVLVDEEFQILRVYGDTRPFLGFKPGEPSLNLLRVLAQPAIHLEVAAHKARSEDCSVTLGGLPDPTSGELTLSLRVTPLAMPDGGPPHLLVSFLRGADAANHSDDSGPKTNSELRVPDASEWSEALRLTHEELEASREELQALNEELRASNDQLNLSNEDLNQANFNLRDKLDELQTQSNVLSSGAVVALFLDEELRMRWFTPGISALYPVKAADVGRRVTDLAPKFDHPDFVADVRGVMQTGEPREAQLRTFDGRSFLKRVRPFRTGAGDGASEGVAITFTDITERASVEAALRESEERITKLVSLIPAGVYTCDAEGVLTFFNRRAVELWGREPSLGDEQEKFCGSLRLWTSDGSRIEHEDCPMADAVRFGRPARNAEVVIEQPSGAQLVASVNIEPLYDREGRLVGAINVFVDVTDRRRAEEALHESQLTLRQNQVWLAAQKEAFQSAMNGDPLATSLGILVRAAVEQSDVARRCAFYLAHPGNVLRHVVGMPESYADRVDGFVISPESLACGLAVATGEPVLTRDVLEEPRWQPWVGLAHDYAYRGCWSFPVETAKGKLVGSFAMYFAEPREPTPRDLELVATLTKTAAIIISRHRGTAGIASSTDTPSEHRAGE